MRSREVIEVEAKSRLPCRRSAEGEVQSQLDKNQGSVTGRGRSGQFREAILQHFRFGTQSGDFTMPADQAVQQLQKRTNSNNIRRVNNKMRLSLLR